MYSFNLHAQNYAEEFKESHQSVCNCINPRGGNDKAVKCDRYLHKYSGGQRMCEIILSRDVSLHIPGPQFR